MCYLQNNWLISLGLMEFTWVTQELFYSALEGFKCLEFNNILSKCLSSAEDVKQFLFKLKHTYKSLLFLYERSYSRDYG